MSLFTITSFFENDILGVNISDARRRWGLWKRFKWKDHGRIAWIAIHKTIQENTKHQLPFYVLANTGFLVRQHRLRLISSACCGLDDIFYNRSGQDNEQSACSVKINLDWNTVYRKAVRWICRCVNHKSHNCDVCITNAEKSIYSISKLQHFVGGLRSKKLLACSICPR